MKPTLIAIDYGKFTENTWVNKSNLKQIEKHLKQDNVKTYKVLEQGDIDILLPPPFFYVLRNVRKTRENTK